MWRQVNSLISQLSPIPRSNRNKEHDEADASAVELSVRHEPRVPAVVELQSLPISRLSPHGSSSHDAADLEHANNHPLVSNGRAAHTQEVAPRNQANYYNCAAGLQPQPSRQVASSTQSSSFQAVMKRLLGQSWLLEQAPSGSRLVLSVLSELAAANPQQQALRTKLQLLADSDSWNCAWMHVLGADALRVLAEHYCPAAATWQGSELQQLPPACSSLEAHFMAATAAAAASWPRDTGASRSSSSTEVGSADLQHLESCVVLGEALQLQQQADIWGCLLRLVPKSTTEVQGLQQQQQQQSSACVVWPIMHAWVAAMLGKSLALPQQQKQQQQAQTQQPQVQHADCGMQLLPDAWDQLLAELQRLQQKVQDAAYAAVSHPLQPAAAAAAAPKGSAAHTVQAVPASRSAKVSSSLPQNCGSDAACCQQRHHLLQELCCGALPALLQPPDLAGPLLLQQDAWPDGMALVALLRLAARTSSLWLPVLRRVPSSVDSTEVSASCRQVLEPHHLQQGCKTTLRLLQLPPAGAEGGSDVSPTEQGLVAEGPLSSGAGPSSNAATPSSAGGDVRSPRSSWPDELLSTAQLWPGDMESEDDAAAITREERTLRCWINSVLHRIAGNSGSSTAVAGNTGQLGLLNHSNSVDSGLPSGRAQLLQRTGAAGVALRSVSFGGVGAVRPAGTQARADPLRSSTSRVFRCSSAGAAAAAARSTTSGAATNAVHSRSISADAGASPTDLSLSGWSTEPAAPSTPTAAGGMSETTTGGPAGASAAAVRVSAAAGTASAAEADRDPAATLGIASVSSLFGAELRSGVLLLEILDLLQPGCVDWRLANKPPFAPRTAQLKALENCQLALRIAQEELGLPLVSMSPRDIVLGRRKIILSLVYQLMRYNTMQLLESISAVQTEQLAHQSSTPVTAGSSAGAAAAAAAAVGRGRVPASMAATQQTGAGQGASQQQLPPLRHFGGGVNFRSSSRKQRGQLAVTEQDILDWANAKLQQVKPLAGTGLASEAPVMKSFKDPVLGSGVVLLQLLHVLAPELVELSYVTAGHTPEQRQSNARYALSLADKMGCSLFLVWEDLVDPPQPRMVLVLLASLMSWDLQRQHA